MNQLFKSKRNTILCYLVFSVVITLLSLFLLFVNVWEASFILSVSTVFDFFYLLIILNFGKSHDGKNGLEKGKNVLVFTIFRTMIEIVSLAICALGIYFIPSLIDEASYLKYRYAFIILGLLPYMSAILFFYLNSKAEGN